MALQESLNNVLERMHGSIREREKIMRGNVDDTPIIPINQIYYKDLLQLREATHGAWWGNPQ